MARSGGVAYWILAVISLLAGIVVLLNALAFPHGVAEHPVPAMATVTRVTHGIEGDPSFDYRYRVEGRVYTGGDSGDLIGEAPSDVRRGDRIEIEYAAGEPSESCTCHAERSAFRNTAAMAVLAALLALPLAFLIFRLRRESPRRREPVAPSA
jgi:hypothetical protein